MGKPAARAVHERYTVLPFLPRCHDDADAAARLHHLRQRHARRADAQLGVGIRSPIDLRQLVALDRRQRFERALGRRARILAAARPLVSDA